MALSDAGNSHTNVLRADDAPVKNLLGDTAAEAATPGDTAAEAATPGGSAAEAAALSYQYWHPRGKVKVDSIFIPKHAQAKPMRGFSKKSVSVRHPGVIGWVKRPPVRPPPAVASASK